MAALDPLQALMQALIGVKGTRVHSSWSPPLSATSLHCCTPLVSHRTGSARNPQCLRCVPLDPAVSKTRRISHGREISRVVALGVARAAHHAVPAATEGPSIESTAQGSPALRGSLDSTSFYTAPPSPFRRAVGVGRCDERRSPRTHHSYHCPARPRPWSGAATPHRLAYSQCA